ncbi:hypothetical protein JCM21900_004095 [Sporobolomyces salmonicolor]
MATVTVICAPLSAPQSAADAARAVCTVHEVGDQQVEPHVKSVQPLPSPCRATFSETESSTLSTRPKYPRSITERAQFVRQSIGGRAGSKVTPFQWKLYDLLLKVPPGKVSTYGQLASLLSSSPRAVGTALRNNPFAPTVPCHRIIASTGYIGGFSGEWTKGKGKMKGRDLEQGPKVTEKLELLKSEGVKFDARGQLKDKACLWGGL